MELLAISPIDGRYAAQVKSLSPFYSEFGLIHYRVRVEIEYLLALRDSGIPQLKALSPEVDDKLRSIYRNFTIANAQQIKETEKTTNHDVKAVEYFIKDEIQKLGLEQFTEFIHFGLTSQDVNNTSIPLLIKESLVVELIPAYKKLVARLRELANDWKDISMLARTHGQPASPTRLGKEIMVFVERLETQIAQLESIPFSAKFGGATGNFNAHHVAYPGIDWEKFAFQFVDKTLGLSRSKYTTQIEHYDNLGALFDALKRINTILIDLNRDVWQYISMNYFKQKIKEGEVGSSAMPHKVNPIDFENSEGNLGVANALFEHFSAKLPISRLQRDLTDSTVLRNVGVPMAHTYIAIRSTTKGIDKLELNKAAIDRDLEENWAVVAEAIQTVLRREGYPKPYEALKALTRKNEKITEATIKEFVATLDVSDAVKSELLAITPFTYTGIMFS
jgi:adenylosuccinate lyase